VLSLSPDENDKMIFKNKLDNNLCLTLKQISVYKDKKSAIAIESTFNRYWLVMAGDGW